MTRFARASGSKASNERLPEEATPWSELKQQLLEKNKEIEESKMRQAVINQRNANYKAFLDKKEEEARNKYQWAEFPTEKNNDKHLTIQQNKKVMSSHNDEDESDDETFSALKAQVDKVLNKQETLKAQVDKVSNKLENNLSKNEDGDSDVPPEEHSSKIQVSPPVIKPKKSKKKKIAIKIPNTTVIKSESSEVINDNGKLGKTKENVKNNETPEKKSKKRKLDENANDELKIKNPKKNENNGNIKEKKKGKQKLKGFTPKLIPKENLTESDLKKIEKKKKKRLRQVQNKKLAKEKLKKQKEEEEKQQIETGETTESPQNQKVEDMVHKISKQGIFDKQNTDKMFKKNPNNLKSFDKKQRDNKEHKRRKPFLPTKMFINGKEIQVDYVEGFPVKKEDAERLKKLRKEMISKGLPRSEINIALKLERRKAEKAFTREKKKVCFNCRKSGHNLSECPELDKGQVSSHAGTGICFKCGSTEHTHFECKVVKGQEFKYAACFICNEQGHIARQCPDNARGLYPKGGACRECGDVTHLKKDCPKYQAQQQQIQNSLSIETIGASNPDVLDDKNQFQNSSLGDRRPNKIVKF